MMPLTERPLLLRPLTPEFEYVVLEPFGSSMKMPSTFRIMVNDGVFAPADQFQVSDHVHTPWAL